VKDVSGTESSSATSDGVDLSTRTLPDFLIVGAMRCGTTSLSNFLSRQPRIGVARGKELHYFDRHHVLGLAWYAQHFEELGKAIVGEATPNYLYKAEVPRRIADEIPNAKLVAILRDPVQRAESHYWHRVARADEPLPMLEALEAENERLAEPARTFPEHVAYVDRSRYGEQLRRYQQWFPVDQMRIIILEEVDRNPVEQMTSLLRWLDPGCPRPDLTPTMWPRRDNSHMRFRSQRLRKLVRRVPGIAGRAIGSVNAVRQAYPAIDPEAEAFIRSRLRDDRRVLEEVLGRSIDVWSPL
jgi:hypothetical protein